MAEDSKRRVTQKERDEQLAKRLSQQQATASLLETPFSHAEAKQAIGALMDAPFSHRRVNVRYPYRDDVHHWVLRAEEARTIAKAMQDSFNRRLMLSIAEAYEALGRRLSDDALT
jgi:hypothetical protein